MSTTRANYTVSVMEHDGIVDPTNDNVDVFVYFVDGRNYVATFFTMKNIESIMRRHHASGENASGRYFWAADMVIVERLDRDVIEQAVADLIETKMFERAFDGPHPFDVEEE